MKAYGLVLRVPADTNEEVTETLLPRSESNCKEHLTDRYRARTSYQLMGSLMDHHTGKSIGHLHSTASCGHNIYPWVATCTTRLASTEEQ